MTIVATGWSFKETMSCFKGSDLPTRGMATISVCVHAAVGERHEGVHGRLWFGFGFDGFGDFGRFGRIALEIGNLHRRILVVGDGRTRCGSSHLKQESHGVDGYTSSMFPATSVVFFSPVKESGLFYNARTPMGRTDRVLRFAEGAFEFACRWDLAPSTAIAQTETKWEAGRKSTISRQIQRKGSLAAQEMNNTTTHAEYAGAKRRDTRAAHHDARNTSLRPSLKRERCAAGLL